MSNINIIDKIKISHVSLFSFSSLRPLGTTPSPLANPCKIEQLITVYSGFNISKWAR